MELNTMTTTRTAATPAPAAHRSPCPPAASPGSGSPRLLRRVPPHHPTRRPGRTGRVLPRPARDLASDWLIDMVGLHALHLAPPHRDRHSPLTTPPEPSQDGR